MAAIKLNRKDKSDTIMLQTSLGIVNEIYAGNNKWLMSKMDGTSAMRWKPINQDLEDSL
ncbi:MAG: hypothetical protein KAS16_04120 [Thermoplasmata archaeon]|nr:hypothetical protein [Thermoplasmata archaeon]